MKWTTFFMVALIVAGIFLFQWPKMKQAPRKDKWVFSLLLLTGWGISLFDIQHISGPIQLKAIIFGPLGQFMKN
ncbi:hypothetical protein [Pseudobacillus wudalianchiensis]|uniref:Uncharacterized protein n=1 Tax=Pseudobacillus wudalianchiensis TaxID=1743143 RepID=A0A1B9AMJ7_9BACI|nr:hypothetical protein [Bacillus wudalianchiensis]OCA85153.1 hypothetical protein A8F95_10760 [Bacillus wudalianchiensis]